MTPRRDLDAIERELTWLIAECRREGSMAAIAAANSAVSTAAASLRRVLHGLGAVPGGRR